MVNEDNLTNKDDYSDPEGYEDNVSDSELLGDLKYQEPNESQYEERCVLVFGIPIAGEDRLEKLKKVLGKLFAVTNPEYKDYYPQDENKNTKGFCFLEYPSKDSAEKASLFLDGYTLDKNHTFSAYLFTALRKIEEPSKNWEPPKKRDYVDVGDLWSWLQNPKCLDQFAVQVAQGDVTSLGVYWNGRNTEPSLVELPRDNWSEHIFKWSPHGTYLATFHKPGIGLWGGEKFELTYSREGHGDVENCLRIFDVFTSEQMKSFSPAGQSAARIHDWPFFKWSYDEKYFAFCRPKGDTINVYETEKFTLCDNDAIKLEGLVTFEWNPTKNLIAYYCEERLHANAPAEIGILEFPSRQKIRAQRIFSVSAANLFWQKSGNYLAAHTERFNNVRKTKGEGIASHLEIFDFTEKEVSVQTIQLPEPFINFAWEPKGDKFCVLIGQTTRVTPLVYRLDKGKPVPQLISKIEPGTQLNTIEWSPQGGWFTVFGINSTPGHVYFVDTNGAEAVRSRIVEHPNMNQGCWDPTGRYFVSCSLGRNRYEAGFRIHSFQGRELYKKNIDSMIRFKWRPRPPVTLSEAKIKEVRKNLKQTSAKFEEEDRREQQLVSKELIEQRQSVMAKFMETRQQVLAFYAQWREERIALRKGIDTETVDNDLVEETVTIPLNTVQEVVQKVAENKADVEEQPNEDD